MTVATVCAGCPFNFVTLERSQLMERAEQGGWIPCKQTAAPAVHGTIASKVSLWRQEEECAGARLWRRDRQLPGARFAA